MTSSELVKDLSRLVAEELRELAWKRNMGHVQRQIKRKIIEINL